MNIGILGTGRMGAAIAGRLLGLGESVRVWNRTAEKTRPLAAAGAKVMPTPVALVQESDVILSLLTDARAIDAAYEGADGALRADLAGKLFIEMSTVRPEDEQALAAKVRAQGGAMVDCPVGGSVGPAKEGKLFGFIGGEAADVARARPVLEKICRRAEHVGPVGAGSRMKLAINLPLLVYWQALAEAIALAEPLGLAPERLMDILADTSGAPAMMKMRAPVVAANLAGKEPTVSVDIKTMRKDLATMLEEARANGRELPVTARTLAAYDAAIAAGWGERDVTMLPVRGLGRS